MSAPPEGRLHASVETQRTGRGHDLLNDVERSGVVGLGVLQLRNVRSGARVSPASPRVAQYAKERRFGRGRNSRRMSTNPDLDTLEGRDDQTLGRSGRHTGQDRKRLGHRACAAVGVDLAPRVVGSDCQRIPGKTGSQSLRSREDDRTLVGPCQNSEACNPTLPRSLWKQKVKGTHT